MYWWATTFYFTAVDWLTLCWSSGMLMARQLIYFVNIRTRLVQLCSKKYIPIRPSVSSKSPSETASRINYSFQFAVVRRKLEPKSQFEIFTLVLEWVILIQFLAVLLTKEGGQWTWIKKQIRWWGCVMYCIFFFFFKQLNVGMAPTRSGPKKTRQNKWEISVLFTRSTSVLCGCL